MAYQSPFRNNTAKTAAQQAATRKKAFYLIVAIAIILISAPVAYMILNGWLGTTEPNADELISDEYYEPSRQPETVPLTTIRRQRQKFRLKFLLPSHLLRK